MAEPRRIKGQGELREIISDAGELSKGAAIFDGKGLSNLARFDNKLFADAAGSGASPYKVSLTFGEQRAEVKARCSCIAARSRPYCKHAAALLVAWSKAPEAFVTTDAAPASPGGAAPKKKAVKQGKADAAELMKTGVEQVSTLVRELALSGVASVAADRGEQVRGLGETLRANGLRRLSARAIEVSHLLDAAAARAGDFEPVAFTDLLADMLLTVRKLEKHLGGEALDNRHVEELIGKTWTKKDRAPIEGLELIEYAFVFRTTPDDYVIRESRFFDLQGGKHYSEKQIIPAFLKNVPPKRSYGGLLLEGAKGSTYPGFAPHRLDLEPELAERRVDGGVLARLVEKALPDVGAALAAFQEHRKDVFAPDLLPVAVRVDALLASGARPMLVDAGGQALFLPDNPKLEEPLIAALEEAKLRVVLGEVGLDAAMPTLYPQAVVIEGTGGLELRALVASEPPKRRRAPPAPPGAQRSRTSWADLARAAGASRAAVALAEVREELADKLSTGLPNLGARAAEPLVARLKELGLEKQGQLLEALAQKPDPADRLDDLVKLYQVLGIALVRLAGSTPVDRATLAAVETHPSVSVRAPEAILPPAEVVRQRLQGKLSRFDAAVHASRYYQGRAPEELLGEVATYWADGSAARYVLKAVPGREALALASARKAVERRMGRIAQYTAIQVLRLIGGREAEQLLAKVGDRDDRPLKARAAEALYALRNGVAPGVEEEKLQHHCRLALTEGQKDSRCAAIWWLEQHGDARAIPTLRQAYYGDPTLDVRSAAARVLASLGDAEMVEPFIRVLAERQEGPETNDACEALGLLGDLRGAEELLKAFTEGWKPAVVSPAMMRMGTSLLPRALELAEQQPELAGRKALLNVFELATAEELEELLLPRITGTREQPRFTERCAVYLKLASVTPEGGRAVGQVVLDAIGPDGDKGLIRAAQKAVSPKKKEKK